MKNYEPTSPPVLWLFPTPNTAMGKYGSGRNGYPSGRTGAADRNFYVEAGKAAKERRESSTNKSSSSNPSKGNSSGGAQSKGFFSSFFGW